MARRSQPYRLSGLPTIKTVEQIDEMFQLLFDDTDNGTMRVRSTQFTGILPLSKGGTGRTTADITTGSLLYGDTTLSDKYGVLTAVAAGSYLRSAGLLTAPVWSTVTLPNTAVTGDLWYASATNVMSALADVATGNALISGGVATAPSWGKIGLTTHVSGTLPTANGGTNQTSWTTGSVVFASSATQLGQNNTKFFWDNTNKWLGIGQATFSFGQIHAHSDSASNGNIRVTGANQLVNLIDLFQANAASAGLNSVGAPLLLMTGGTERLRVPTTATSIVLAVPLAAASGGTGFASYAVGDVLYADTTTTLAKLADVSAGSYLRSGGVSTAPVWSTVKLPNTATTGDVWYASAANTMSALADVAAGSYLRSGGVATAPVWSSVTLPNAAAIGDIWYASTTGAMTALADVAVGSYLRSGGVNTAPLWSTTTLPNTAAQGDLWYGSASNVISALAKDTNATRYLANTGTNNNPAWAQVNVANGITGNVPVANLGNGTWTKTTNSSTGAQNNLSLGVTGNTYCEWSGASDMTVTGVSGGATGLELIVKNTGSAVAYFAHNSGSSSAGNVFTNLVTSGSTPIAPKGWIRYIYDGSNWVYAGHDQGGYITPTFSGSDYTMNGDRTWTVDSGDVTTQRWKLIGRSLHQVWVIKTSTVSGGSSSSVLKIQIPNGYTSTEESLALSVYILVASTAYVGYVLTTAAGTVLNCAKLDTSDIGTGTNNITVDGQTLFAVT